MGAVETTLQGLVCLCWSLFLRHPPPLPLQGCLLPRALSCRQSMYSIALWHFEPYILLACMWHTKGLGCVLFNSTNLILASISVLGTH